MSFSNSGDSDRGKGLKNRNSREDKNNKEGEQSTGGIRTSSIVTEYLYAADEEDEKM